MSITITIIANDIGELHRDLASLLTGTAPVTVSGVVDAKLSKAQVERAIKAAESQKADDAARQKLQDDRDAAAKQEAPGELASAAANTSATSSATTEATTGGATAAPAGSSPAASTGEIDYETQIKPLVLKLAEAQGREGVLKVLDQYGVTNAQHVPAEHRAELIEHLNKALAA